MKTLIVGNGLDSLITSYQLVKSGHDVMHWHSRKVAGHFSGYLSDHGIFDSGMVLLEQDDRNAKQSNLELFNSEFGKDARKFLKTVYLAVKRVFGDYSEHPVFTLTDKFIEVNDYFISDNLDLIRDYNIKDPLKSISESAKKLLHENNQNEDTFHPRLKSQMNVELQPGLTQYLQDCYGENAYKQLFGHFIRALTGQDDVSIPAKFHRKLWLPLYFPENLTEQGLSDLLKPTKFYTFQGESLATKIEKVKKYLRSQPNFVEINRDFDIDGIENFNVDSTICMFSTPDLLQFSNRPAVVNLAQKIDQEIYGITSNPINIVHFCVNAQKRKTVFIQEPISGLFRYTFTDRGGNEQTVASFEFGTGSPVSMTDYKKVILNLIPGLEFQCGGSLQALRFGPKYLNMDQLEWNNFVANVKSELFQKSVGIEIIHPDAVTFNDNCTRGFAISERIGVKSD